MAAALAEWDCAKKFNLDMKLNWQSLNHEKQIF